MSQTYVAITGLGYALGELPVSNQDVAQNLIEANTAKKIRAAKAANPQITQDEIDAIQLTPEEISHLSTTDEWVVSRTGITKRHYTKGSTSALAAQAVREAVIDSDHRLNDLQFILVATVSPDYLYAPPTGCLVHKSLGLKIQDELGLKNFLPADIGGSCSSFAAALILGHSLIASGLYSFGVVVGADKMSSTFDPSNRDFSSLLGDAAGAIVLEATEDPASDAFPWGTKSFFFGTDPSGAENIIAPAGGSAQPMTLDMMQKAETTLGAVLPNKLRQDGKKVFKDMIKFIPGMLEEVVKRAGLSLADINYIFPHQANLRLIEPIKKELVQRGFAGKMSDTIINFANTTSAAIPLGMATAWENLELEPGMILVLNAFGAGYTYSCIIVKWRSERFCVGV